MTIPSMVMEKKDKGQPKPGQTEVDAAHRPAATAPNEVPNCRFPVRCGLVKSRLRPSGKLFVATVLLAAIF